MPCNTIYQKNKKMVRKQQSDQKEDDIRIRLSDCRVVKKSLSEQELFIQGNRILYLIDKLIKKITVAVCIQRLQIYDGIVLRSNLQPEDVELIQSVFPSSNSKSCSIAIVESKQSTVSFSMSKKHNFMGDYESEEYNNPAMLRALEIIWLNPKIYLFLQDQFTKGYKSEVSLHFVETVKRLRQVMSSKLSQNGVEKLMRDKSLRQAWKYNARIHQEIKRLEKELENQREVFEIELGNKYDAVAAYQKDIELFNLNGKNEMLKICTNSENEMLEDSHASEMRQQDLAEESKSVVLKYENLLINNLREEKLLRAKRSKAQQQLANWILKYDSDMGERQAELDIINKYINHDAKELEALNQRFTEQEIEYQKLMAEKQEIELAMWTERAYQFLINRSARRIQRAWRAYKKRKLQRALNRRARARARIAAKAMNKTNTK